MLTPLQIDLGRFLVGQAVNRQLTTYRELARAINWSHEYGRGLGKELWEVLRFTHENGLPCLTSILCKAGTRSPPDDGLKFIQQVYGTLNIAEEQKRVFSFDWVSVPEFAYELPQAPEVDFARMYATRTWGFDPANWGMTGFSSEKTRDRILEQMDGEPIYIAYFCSQHVQETDGPITGVTIAPHDRARVLGIVEAQPVRASHDTHTSQAAIKDMRDRWGETRWNHGLETSRAWAFVSPPWTREALPVARSASWEASRGIVALADEEERLLRQYTLREVSVYGRVPPVIAYSLREPMHTTYLAVCGDADVLRKANAPAGTRLVKIGVSGDTNRRLRDLNDHHFAKIFHLKFHMYATHRWSSQNEALARETAALEWAHENATRHASGEYFFMTDRQQSDAATMVKPVKTVR